MAKASRFIVLTALVALSSLVYVVSVSLAVVCNDEEEEVASDQSGVMRVSLELYMPGAKARKCRPKSVTLHITGEQTWPGSSSATTTPRR